MATYTQFTNPFAAAISGLNEGFLSGYKTVEDSQLKRSAEDRAQALFDLQKRAAEQKLAEQAMEEQALTDLQKRMQPELRPLTTGNASDLGPIQPQLNQFGNQQLAGLMASMPKTVSSPQPIPPAMQGLMGTALANVPKSVLPQIPITYNAQVANPAYASAEQQARQKLLDMGNVEIPAAKLTNNEILEFAARGGDRVSNALKLVTGTEAQADKLQSLRDMLELRQKYAQEASKAKNEADLAKIQMKYQNDVELMKSKYENIRDIKLISAARGSSGQGMGKAPVGYRFDTSGNLEAIPGGPADIKAQDRALGKEGSLMLLDQSINSLNDLMQHPGRKGATGTLKTSFIPGTEAADWAAKLDTFKAQTFVPMVSQLKGMGALSDAEGKKLTEAVGALDRSKMSEKGMLNSMKQIMKELEDKRNLAVKYTTKQVAPQDATPSNLPKIGEVRDGYMYLGGNPSDRKSWGKR